MKETTFCLTTDNFAYFSHLYLQSFIHSFKSISHSDWLTRTRALFVLHQFLVFISHVIKTENRNRSINKLSKIWDMIDDCNVNNLAKNQVSAVFHSRVIRRSVSFKFTEICMEMPCWGPSGWAPTWRPETNRNIRH